MIFSPGSLRILNYVAKNSADTVFDPCFRIFNSILNDNFQNSLLSAAPYLGYWIISMSFGPLSDMLINRKIVTRGTSRKIFNSIGMILEKIVETI